MSLIKPSATGIETKLTAAEYTDKRQRTGLILKNDMRQRSVKHTIRPV